MIPKKIHYCWFGGKPLDDLALKCIESWKKYFPGYEIIQWNETNFDVSQMKFMEEAYKNNKWAFVSDVARLIVIYQYGGIYFDTDVEVICDYRDILRDDVEGFLGVERLKTVATGLGFGAIQKHPFIKELISIYNNIDFNQFSDCLSKIACPILTTELMEKKGYIYKERIQDFCGFRIYPSEYFSPIDYMSGKMFKTEQTHSIHWYSSSWNTEESKKEHITAQKLRRIFGVKIGDLLYGIMTCMKKEGIIKYIITRLMKVVCKK